MKCSNCGAEVAEGMKFCGDCGAPVPQVKKCISCGAEISLKMKFCPECGANQEGSASGKQKFNAAAFAMGDKNVIAGDVVGHQETTHITGNATIIKNEDQSKQVKRCHVCGSLVMITDGFECPECGEFTCGSCYDANENACKPCAQKRKGQSSSMAEAQYNDALKNALTDGRIDLEERKNLNALQKKLGISNDKAMEMERALKGAGTGDEEIFTTAEKLELEKAREQFYGCEGNLADILKTVEGIYRTHPTNEKALSLYLPCLAASGKENEVLKINDELGADVLSCYITAIDICLTKEDMTEAEKWLRKAAVVFAESNVLKCYQAYYYLKMYKKYGDFSFLEKATNANASLKDVNGALELSHQLRVMSLLQVESDEEPPVYDKNFCKENGLYFRVVANVSLGGVYVEGGCTGGASGAGADSEASKDYIYNYEGTERTVRFYQDKDGKGRFKYLCIISRPTPDWVDPEEADYIIAYPLSGNLNLACYNSDDWDEDEDEEMRNQEKYDWTVYFNQYVLRGKQVATSEVDFFTEESVSEKLDDQIESVLKAEVHGDWDFVTIIPLKDLDGTEYTDISGTKCFMDTARIQIVKNSNDEYIYALPVKKMLENESEWPRGGEIFKIPFLYEGKYRGIKFTGVEFNSYLRCAQEWKQEDANGLYLLDKDGKRITSVQDFDYSEPDKDGNIYYPVPGSDLVDEDSYSPLTSAAIQKWKAKLGL